MSRDPCACRHVLGGRRLDDLRERSAATAWSTRSSTTTSWPRSFFEWDGANADVPQPGADFGSGTSARRTIPRATEYGRLIVPPGSDDKHVDQGEHARRSWPQYRRAAAEVRRQSPAACGTPPDFADNLKPRASNVSTNFAATGVARTPDSGEAIASSSTCSTVPCKDEPGARTRRCGRSARPGPVLRGARHRRHPRHQGWTEHQQQRSGARHRRTSRFPACTGWATASRPRPGARTGRAAPRSGRSSHSPIARRTPPTASR